MHKALYRVYRPKFFSDIVGQDQIVKVLVNQIKSGNLSHAYLFTGPRGTGKTSTAKIFAKAVNCIGDVKPCYSCSVCKDSDMDVLELDAASNNSVDNIREIRDTVSFAPAVGRFKVYIIDEVHMLSPGAFNALLKTLEEPPEHVIFILATTEPHKIPQTVLSRCQRFDFRKISMESCIDLLKDVLFQEGHEFDNDAVEFVARKSDGGMRDALMLLDKALSYGNVTLENVRAALGDFSSDVFGRFVHIIEDRNVKEALLMIDELDANGRDLKLFLSDMIEFFRDALMYKAGVDNGFDVEVKLSANKLADYMEAFCNILSEIKFSPMPKLILQAHLVKLLSEGTDFVDNNEVVMLRQEVMKLRGELEELKKNGIGVSEKKAMPVKKEAPARKMKDRPNGFSKVLTEDDKEKAKVYDEKFRRLIDMLKKNKQAPLAAILSPAKVHCMDNDKLIIVYDEPFYLEILTKDDKISIMEQFWNKAFEEKISVVPMHRSELPSDDSEEKKHDETLNMLREAFPGVEIEIK